MPWFKDLPIKRKLSTTIMTTCTIVMLLACGAFVINEYINSRRELMSTVRTLASISADNLTAALAFQNKVDARRTLQTLQAEQRIIDVALYDSAGFLFAYYGGDEPAANTPVPPLGYHFSHGELRYVQLVSESGQNLGTLVVRASLSQIYADLRTYLGITGIILLVSFGAAWVFSSALRQRIAKPILELAETTRKVSHQNNYSARATKHGNDELGELTDSFNRMMMRIQESDWEVRKSQERLKLALEAGHIGTWDWDPREKAFYWDQYVYALLGVKVGEMLPTLETLLGRVHPQDRDVVRETMEALRRGDRSSVATFRIVFPDGTVRHLSSRAGTHGDEANVQRVTGVLIDITQTKRAEEEVRRLNEELEQRVLKRTEQLAAANRELESFTYSVSHDLRAPLRHINGFAQMLEQEFTPHLSDEARRLLSRIRNGARNMGQLVDDLLRLARVGRQPLTYQQCSLGELVAQILREMASELETRKIEWHVGELPTVPCDAGLIRQVFANLLSNAVKYSRTRELAVISVESSTTEHDYIVSVRDNGVGFDMKYAEKLFGVFQRLHRIEDFEGTGVGLAIVHRIVQKHGGRVFVDAAVDNGATFSFTLPKQRSET